jgi:hypothetical protein
MGGKSPLGLSKDAQAYEGANIVLPPGGAAIIKTKQNPPFPKPGFPVPTIAVNTVSEQAFIQVYPGTWQQFGTSINDFTATTGTILGNTTYLADNGSLVTLTLPANAPQGTTVTVIGKGAGGWKIAQLASQEIFSGSSHTTSGVTGTLAGGQYSAVTLMSTDAAGAGLNWIVVSNNAGTLTFT